MESKNFQSLLSRALRKLVSVGLIIKNKPTSTKRYIFTKKNSSSAIVERKPHLTKRSRTAPKKLDRSAKVRTKGSNNPSNVSNEPSLTRQNVERLLFGLIDPRRIAWSPSDVRMEANKWVKETTVKKLEMLIQAHQQLDVDTIISQRIDWFLAERDYEPFVSSPSSYQNLSINSK
jgi:hypothetical protein